MRRRRKKSRAEILFVILILLLSSLVTIGGSYGFWYDKLYVDGEITTGHWYTEQTAWARMYDDPDDYTHQFTEDNWASFLIHKPTEEKATFYLYAGKHYRVGELYVWKDDDNLYVEYDFDSPVTMSIAQLHIATSLDGFPLTKKGNPKIGNFDHIREYPWPYSSGDLFEIEWKEEWDDEDLYIGAHADVWGDWEEDL